MSEGDTNLLAGRGQHRPCRKRDARCRKTPYPARLTEMEIDPGYASGIRSAPKLNLFYRFTPWSHPPNLVVIHEPVLEICCGQTQCAQTDTQTDTQTHRHTPMTTRPCGLRRAGNQYCARTESVSLWPGSLRLCGGSLAFW